MAATLRIGYVAMGLLMVTPSVAAAQVGENRPPGAPLHVSPAPGHRFEHGEPQRFSVAAIDPDLEPYSATLTIRDADTQTIAFQGTTHTAPSGLQATAVALPPLPPGQYTWSAHATDVRGATGPESVSASIEVGPPAVAGAGALKGTFEYDQPGLRKLACSATRFDVDAQAHVGFADVVLAGFAGSVTITGSGSSSCEDLAFGPGALTLAVDGVGSTGSRLSCPVVQGPYTRIGTTLVATLGGECVVNGFTTGRLTWIYAAQAAPLDGGGGATERITRTTFDGAFAIRSLLRTDAGPEI